jgi:hypothetical protein
MLFGESCRQASSWRGIDADVDVRWNEELYEPANGVDPRSRDTAGDMRRQAAAQLGLVGLG